MLQPPRILIVGTGALGSLYGCMLARAGAEVSCVCRSDYDAIAADGIRVDSTWGQLHCRPVEVLRRAADISRPPDFILVTHKVLPEADTAALVRGAVGPTTAIVLLQNGIEIEAPVAAAYPDNEVISALAFVCSFRTAPGQVKHIDYGRITVGTWPSGLHAGALRFCQLLQDADVPVQSSTDIVTARWRKLLWNVPFNPLTVLGGCVDTRTTMNDAEARTLARELMLEVCRIAEAAGYHLAETDVTKNLRDTEQMRPYRPSMCLDREAGRPMEVEAILGNTLRIARRYHLQVPYLQAVYTAMHLLDDELRRRAAGASA